MERAPAISVVLPAYNSAPFLREAVESILAQTERDFELILINDGSTDDTDEIARQLSFADGRIRYFVQENLGIVAALNRGLELCKGDFIARMDADDVARADRFEQQLKLLRARPDVVICGSEAQGFGDVTGRIRKPCSDSACRAWLFLDPCFVHPTVMFRRTIVDRGIRYRKQFLYGEDYDFWCEAARVGRMANIGQPLLRYRFHAGQLTTTRRAAQEWVHVDIARARLVEAGIPVTREGLHEILWPDRSTRARLPILLSACNLFARLAARGSLVPYLMLATLWKIARSRRSAPPPPDNLAE